MKSALVAFALGCMSLEALPQLFPLALSWTLTVFVLLLLLVLLYLRTRMLPQLQGVFLKRPRFQLLYSASAFAAIFIIGLLWAQWWANQALQQRLPVGFDRELEAVGYVESLPQHEGERLRFMFRLVAQDTFDAKLNTACSPSCVWRVDWYRAKQEPQAGEKWRLKLRIRPPQGPLNDQGFDAERQALLQGWGAQAVVRDQFGIREATAPAYSILALRGAWVTWLQTQFSPISAGILSALLLGERGGLQTTQWEQLARTGTSHLLAISGLHVGLVAGLMYAFFWHLSTFSGRFWPLLLLRFPAPWWATLGALPAAAAYAFIAGLLVPTQRALIMLLIAAVALFLRRQSDPWLFFLWAMAVVLFANPLAAMSPGLWLSFGAVAWLIYGFHQRSDGSYKLTRGQTDRAVPEARLFQPDPLPDSLITRLTQSLQRGLFRFAKAQLLVSVGLFPLTLLFFQQTSLAGPLVNALAVPWVSLWILPLGLLGMLIHAFGGDWPGLWWLLDGSVQLLDQGIAQAAHWPWAQWQASADLIPAVLALLGLVHALGPRGLPLRNLAWCWCLPLISPLTNGPEAGELWLYQFDVGQGSALALRTHNHVLLYDTGPGDGARQSWFEAAVLPVLRRWPQADLLLLSHADLDHAGGLQALRRRWPAQRELASFKPFQRCVRGQHWEWDGFLFSVLHPGAYLPYLGNESSCVLQVRRKGANEATLLIPGDLGREGERMLMQAWLAAQGDLSDLRSEVLVLGHHGSRNSTSGAWLAALQPRWALLSRGVGNRFGFPHHEVLQRLEQHQVTLLDSAICGGILLRFTNNGEGRRMVPPQMSWARQQTRWWRSKQNVDCAFAPPP